MSTRDDELAQELAAAMAQSELDCRDWSEAARLELARELLDVFFEFVETSD